MDHSVLWFFRCIRQLRPTKDRTLPTGTDRFCKQTAQNNEEVLAQFEFFQLAKVGLEMCLLLKHKTFVSLYNHHDCRQVVTEPGCCVKGTGPSEVMQNIEKVQTRRVFLDSCQKEKCIFSGFRNSSFFIKRMVRVHPWKIAHGTKPTCTPQTGSCQVAAVFSSKSIFFNNSNKSCRTISADSKHSAGLFH